MLEMEKYIKEERQVSDLLNTKIEEEKNRQEDTKAHCKQTRSNLKMLKKKIIDFLMVAIIYNRT